MGSFDGFSFFRFFVGLAAVVFRVRSCEVVCDTVVFQVRSREGVCDTPLHIFD